MTTEDYAQIAKQVAQHEIMTVANELAKQVYDMVAKGVNLAPVVERIDVCLAEQNRFNVVLNALVEVLIDKGAFTREELTDKAEAVADEAIAKNQERHRTMVAKARQEREAAERAGVAEAGAEAAAEQVTPEDVGGDDPAPLVLESESEPASD